MKDLKIHPNTETQLNTRDPDKCNKELQSIFDNIDRSFQQLEESLDALHETVTKPFLTIMRLGLDSIQKIKIKGRN